MRLNLKSYNIDKAINYLIRHIIKHKGNELSLSEIAGELGVSEPYLKKKMIELKVTLRTKRRKTSEKERFFKRFDNAPWNRNIYFTRSSMDTIWHYLELWRKSKGLKRYPYLIFKDSDTDRVIVYLPKP